MVKVRMKYVDSNRVEQKITFLLVNESFSIEKNVFNVPIPETLDSQSVQDISNGSFVMALGGSRKTLNLSGIVTASSFDELVFQYNILKSWANNFTIGYDLTVEIVSDDEQTVYYSYRGVLSSMYFRILPGEAFRIVVQATVYVGEVG